jgi:excisionase family DNA binding protein
MSETLLTVEAAAKELQLHPKTILRFIREGRLRASKVGKQYRILRSELGKFTGVVVHGGAAPARATSIVDIEGVNQVLLDRLSAMLLGALKGRDPLGEPMSLDIAHDPIRRSVKVIAVGAPGDVGMLLKLVDTCLEN